jgi:hypothetical protein
MTRVRSVAREKDFSSNLCVQTDSGANPASYSVGTGGKARPGCDADHTLPSSTEVKNEQELYLLFSQAPPWRVVGQLYFKRRKSADCLHMDQKSPGVNTFGFHKAPDDFLAS